MRTYSNSTLHNSRVCTTLCFVCCLRCVCFNVPKMCLTFVYSTATNLLNIFGDMLLSVRHTDSFVRRILQTTNRAYHKSLFPNAIGISITAPGHCPNVLHQSFDTCLHIDAIALLQCPKTYPLNAHRALKNTLDTGFAFIYTTH